MIYLHVLYGNTPLRVFGKRLRNDFTRESWQQSSREHILESDSEYIPIPLHIFIS